ncbi:hypothetical protein KAR10_02660, partial [bacterium]|nr:hypothetical protein [bacterium]
IRIGYPGVIYHITRAEMKRKRFLTPGIKWSLGMQLRMFGNGTTEYVTPSVSGIITSAFLTPLFAGMKQLNNK